MNRRGFEIRRGARSAMSSSTICMGVFKSCALKVQAIAMSYAHKKSRLLQDGFLKFIKLCAYFLPNFDMPDGGKVLLKTCFAHSRPPRPNAIAAATAAAITKAEKATETI